MSDSVLVLVCNKNYLPFAKRLFSNALSTGKWRGDLLLITDDPGISPFAVDFREVQVKHVQRLKDDLLWSIYNPIVLNKLNIFEEDMKRWQSIVFLDCDTTIQGDINELGKVTAFSAVPYNAYKLNALFLHRESATYKELLKKYDLDVTPLNTGVMAFPSSIISSNTFREIYDLYLKYKYIIYSDDEVINLYFYKRWKKLPVTYSFDYEHYKRYLINKRPPRIIHYVRTKEWQEKTNYRYGKPSRLQDFIYELISSYHYARSRRSINLKSRLISSILHKSKYVQRLAKELDEYKMLNRFPPGHYHSPIPDKQEIEEHYALEAGSIEGIDFDFKNQQPMLDAFIPFYKDIPWSFSDDRLNSTLRYKMKGSFYRYSDAIFLHLIMRKYKPSRIIEVGSGFSSAIMLDTNDLFFQDRRIDFTFIEPNPQDRLNSLIIESDKNNCKIYTQKVQDVDPAIYKELQENDILFIDSSHVSKAGSDFNYIMFTILPLLNKGVLIHFHDVFYPFEYPKDWLTEERFFWNECYFLRAFLMRNNNYKIIFFNSAAHKYKLEYLKKNMPEVLIDHEHCGAFWIQKE